LPAVSSDEADIYNRAALLAAIESLIPPAVIASARALNCELYLVGGSLRDLLLGRGASDLDLAVVGDALELARRAGKSHGAGKIALYARFQTALLQLPEGKIEFASARRESYQADSRKPATVSSATIEEDLARRDFTVNALAYGLTGPHQGELIDRFDGLGDLERRILRTPLEPETTFRDDPLRMLRAIRFAAELDFGIAPETLTGIKQCADRIGIVASERIGDEFLKMLAGRDPVRAMQLMIETGFMTRLVPEVMKMSGVEQVGRHHHKDVLIHSLKVMQNVVNTSPDPIVRLAGLLHDVGKPRTKRFEPQIGWTFHGHEVVGARIVEQIARRLCIGNDESLRLTKLVRLHMRPVNLTDEGVTDSAIRRLMVDAADILDEQLVLCRADITTANPRLVERYLTNFNEMADRMGDVAARDRMRNFQSPVRGEEIMVLCDLPAGPLIGVFKGRIEDAILDGVIPYEYDAAKEYLLKIKDEVLRDNAERLLEEKRQRARVRRSITRDFAFPKPENGGE